MLRAIGTRSGFALVLVFLILVGILLRSTGRLGLVEDLTYSLFSPIQTLLIDVTNGSGDLLGGYRDVSSLRAQIKQLEAQLNKATIDTVRVRELEIENAQLREQLGYRTANADLDVVGASILERDTDPARVIAQDPLALTNYIIIDQGRDAGLELNMPVVTPAGLVGRIAEVGGSWSRVLLITDASSSVNAVVQSSRATGLIQGQGGNELLLNFLPQGEPVKENDLVLTSGIGGRFPKRLVIGQVTKVAKRESDSYVEAVVRPSVDFNRLEFVLVLKEFKPSDILSEPTPTPLASPTASPTPAARRSPTPTAGP